jgi:hypothetical protein
MKTRFLPLILIAMPAMAQAQAYPELYEKGGFTRQTWTCAVLPGADELAPAQFSFSLDGNEATYLDNSVGLARLEDGRLQAIHEFGSGPSKEADRAVITLDPARKTAKLYTVETFHCAPSDLEASGEYQCEVKLED